MKALLVSVALFAAIPHAAYAVTNEELEEEMMSDQMDAEINADIRQEELLNAINPNRQTYARPYRHIAPPPKHDCLFHMITGIIPCLP